MKPSAAGDHGDARNRRGRIQFRGGRAREEVRVAEVAILARNAVTAAEVGDGRSLVGYLSVHGLLLRAGY